MKMIATTTVIRGNGACKVFVDGIMNEEIEKMNERHKKEMEAVCNELEATKSHLNRSLKRDLAPIRAMVARRSGLLYKIREKIEFVWGCIWYYGLRFKLWGYWDDSEQGC